MAGETPALPVGTRAAACSVFPCAARQAGFGADLMEMRRVAILGPGLLGGSLALDLSAGGQVDLRLWGRRGQPLEVARRAGVSGRCTTDLGEAVDGADLVVLATPVGIMPSLAERLVKVGQPPRLVTDMGSVKRAVERDTAPILRAAGIDFIGSHPMCGSEQAGMEAARAGLFRGATCVVCPPEGEAGEDPALAVSSFWEGLGCQVRRMGADDHDHAVAAVSHLPHAAAAMLAGLSADEEEGVLKIAAGGYRDSTRVAMGPPPMWREILMENRDAVLPLLRAFGERVAALADGLEAVDGLLVEQILDEGRKARERFDALSGSLSK